jgi:serine/threonine protein kinase
MLDVGETFLGRFEIKAPLGMGGMAEVYLAFDAFSQREVAIKLTRLRLFEDPEVGARMRRMWLNETHLAGKLHHPYIVDLYEAGVTDDFGYLVMEYVNGDTLQAYVQPDKLLPEETVVEIIYKVCNALDYAASMGLLHRDIKPANVMLAADKSVKVTDFGTCYLTNTEETQVFDVGTPSYMPPEQFTRQTPTVQSDIYAVGVMAYQLLTGVLPFNADALASLVHAKLYEDFVPIETRRKGIAPALRRTIQRAMDRNLDVRYRTWQALCEDLALSLPQINQPRAVMSDSARFDVLRKLSFFSGFPDAQLWEAVRAARWREETASTVIFEEGSVGAAVYIIISGEAIVTRGGAMLNTIGAGECFGEIAFIDESWPVRSATVVAHSPVVLMEMDAETLRQSSDAMNNAFSRALTKTLIGRIRSADQRLLDALSLGISLLTQNLGGDAYPKDVSSA